MTRMGFSQLQCLLLGDWGEGGELYPFYEYWKCVVVSDLAADILIGGNFEKMVAEYLIGGNLLGYYDSIPGLDHSSKRTK